MNEIKVKKCSGICGKVLELNSDNFKTRKDSKDGFRGQCIKCHNKNGVDNNIVEENGIKYKICSGNCKQTLELNNKNFNWRSYKFRDQCKNCQGKGVPSHIIEENGIKYQICTGECKLKKELNEDNFYWRNDSNKFRNDCIICFDNANKKHNEEHKKEISIYKKEYNSRPEVKKRRSRKQNQKRKEDPKTKIHHNISNRIREHIKKLKQKKQGSVLDYLPYTIQELKQHIESLFEPWMTWNNWGIYNPGTWIEEDKSTWTWQIDHMDPHSGFEYTSMEDQEFKDCWVLSNLRPYSAKLNQHDGSTRIRHKRNNSLK